MQIFCWSRPTRHRCVHDTAVGHLVHAHISLGQEINGEWSLVFGSADEVSTG